MTGSRSRLVGLMMSMAVFGAMTSNGQEGPLELRKNAVVTVTPAKYNTPAIVLRDGKYHQLFAPWDVKGCRSSIQVANGYSDAIAFNCDSVMIYSLNENVVRTWMEKDDIYNIDMMLAINRAGLKWADAHPECIQTKSDGSRMLHGAKGSYYMVPTLDFIEYTWDIVKRAIIMFRPVTIAFEEPEMWNQSGYSDGFKAEWKAYFKEEWQDPQSSPEAMLKSMELKTWLFERIIGVMYERIEKLASGTKMYIATHSTVNYNAWGITAGLNHYMATGKVDGIIGQTWSDTIRTPFRFRGDAVRDEYLAAYVDFASYVDSTEGTNFFALADPMCDSHSSTEMKNRYAYLQTIVASLMRPEIHRFELCPWVYRAFGNVSQQYRTMLQQCFNALNMVSGKEIELEAGTPGIAYALSDTMSWLKKNAWSPATSVGFYGIMMPLTTVGIPVSVKSMEQLYTADDLSDVKVLIVSYDNMLPMSGVVNDAIAAWVRNGGTLMLLSGQNDYWRMPDRFWTEKGSPVADLLSKLGVEAKVETEAFADNAVVNGCGDFGKSDFAELVPSKKDRRFMISYSGIDEGKALFKSGGRMVGFETAVGKGRLLAVGLPSTYYSTDDGCGLMRALTAHAAKAAGLQYVETNLMTIRRGRVVATHALRQDEALPGRYIDLYDGRLPIVTNPLVKAVNSRLLFDISGFDMKIPRLAFSGGEILEGSLAEDDVMTQFTYTAASDSTIATRILVPAGMYPAEITALCEGEPIKMETTWNGGSSSLLLQSAGNAKRTVVTVTWSDKPVESVPDVEAEIIERDDDNMVLRPATGVFDDGDFVVSEKDGVKTISRTVKTNNSNLDGDFLLKNSAAANDGLRFCDRMGQLVYVFDTKGTTDYTVDLCILQNYYIEISGDMKHWKMIADYSQNGTVEHLKNGGNQTVLTVKAADHDLAGKKMYIRISNTDTTQGWGGSIAWLRVSYMRK
ncbi:MAG: hypothetical protein K5787_12855 [Lentisphaeria bacterium]|nr:hypothetical protein [Lentisphaeria bacterium]